MTGTNMSRKSPLHCGQIGKKLPGRLAKKSPQNSNVGSVPRPRRFSLLYSSDSSDSEGSDMDGNNLEFKEKQRKGGIKAKSISSNAGGKTSKLIRRSSETNLVIEEEESETDEGEAIVPEEAVSSDDEEESDDDEEESDDDEEDDDDEDDDEEDDDDSDSDSESNDSSSSEEDIDFVKLQAQRKKKSMMALSALKRDGSNLVERGHGEKLEEERRQSPKKTVVNAAGYRSQPPPLSDASDTDEEIVNADALSISKNGRRTDTGKDIDKDSEEDIGEEVQDMADTTKNDNPLEIFPDGNLNQLHVPHFSDSEDSEDSEYNIDQDAYFNAIEDENDLVGIEDTLDPNEDEDGKVLRAEEHMMSVLQNDDNISFDGSIRESGSDPAETMSISAAEQNNSADDDDDDDDDNDDGDESDDGDDEMMTVFDMPFYEDPKFASLYYCEDGSEPRLGLSTSLPLLMSDEKMLRRKRREAKKLARKEHMQRRKQIKEKRSRIGKSRINMGYDDEEFMFGVFFNSDQDDSEHAFNDGNPDFKKKLDFESPLRRLEHAADSGISTDDEYDNILMDIANLSSSDDSDDDGDIKDKEFHDEETKGDQSSDGLELELGDSDDELQDDSSVTNVFIDIDDLDPDSFYFHYSEDGASTSYSEMMTDDTDIDEQTKEKKSDEDAMETITYANDESTDEDDNLPPPSSRSKNIGTKAKEVVSANVVGLRPPKLGTWETDSKPFSIIDGLSTKSLYPLIQEHQHLLEQQRKAQSQSPEYHPPNEATSINRDELTLNELLNMSELEDDDATPSYSQAFSDWYQKPSVPLSAFRNKGITLHEDDELLLPINSTRKVPIGYIGSERTRRKIDKVKELQRKKNEKKRKLKKRKKLLKLKRKKQRADKRSRMQERDALGMISESKVSLEFPDPTFIMDPSIQDIQQETEMQLSRRNSVKSVGLSEIHEILGNDSDDLLESNTFFDANVEDMTAMEISDADLLASLTAPVDFNDINHRPSRRRRQSMVEAAAENLRFTKNGLFSETALADIEGFFNGSGITSNAFEFSETLQ